MKKAHAGRWRETKWEIPVNMAYDAFSSFYASLITYWLPNVFIDIVTVFWTPYADNQ